MYIDSNDLEFRESDVVKYGKEYMFNEAQRCLDNIVQIIKRDREYKESQEKKKEEVLNKKFDLEKTKNMQ